MNIFISSDASASYLFLVGLACKATFLLFLVLFLGFTLRRFSAASRHVLWALAAGTLLSLPLLEALLPSWRLTILPAEPITVAQISEPAAMDPKEKASFGQLPSAVESDVERPPVALPTPEIQPAHVALKSEQAAPSSSASGPSMASGKAGGWRTGIVLLWLLGALFMLALVSIAHLRIAVLVRQSRRLPPGHSLEEHLSISAAALGVRPRVDVCFTARNSIPFTCGLWRPVIFLPEEAEEWSEEKVRAVLLHELAHVKRRDCLTQCVAQVCAALYWFHPLVWFLHRQRVSSVRRRVTIWC